MYRLQFNILHFTFLLIFLNGCGSSRTYQTAGLAEEEVPITGDSIIVTGNGDVNITYVEVGDGSIYIDCGTGGCGDIYIGNEFTDADVIINDVEEELEKDI